MSKRESKTPICLAHSEVFDALGEILGFETFIDLVETPQSVVAEDLNQTNIDLAYNNGIADGVSEIVISTGPSSESKSQCAYFLVNLKGGTAWCTWILGPIEYGNPDMDSSNGVWIMPEDYQGHIYASEWLRNLRKPKEDVIELCAADKTDTKKLEKLAEKEQKTQAKIRDQLDFARSRLKQITAANG